MQPLRILTFALVMAATATVGATARATQLVAFQLSGTVEYTDAAPLAGIIQVGDTYTATLVYDVDTPVDTTHPKIWSYLAGPPSGITLTFYPSGFTFSPDVQTVGDFSIIVSDDAPTIPTTDRVRFASNLELPAEWQTDYSKWECELSLHADASLFSGFAIPSSLDLADFEEAFLDIFLYHADGFGFDDIYVSVESLAPVPVTPDDAVEQLIDSVVELLPPTTATPLVNKLDGVLASLTSPNADLRMDAAHRLNAFINLVRAQRGKSISAADADLLIESAEAVLDML